MGYKFFERARTLFVVILISFWFCPFVQIKHSGVDAIIPIEEFFSFGLKAGDEMLEQGDDFGQKINLTHSFPFFGLGSHDSLFVNVNGAISFNEEITVFTANCTPGRFAMISPFWTDIDTREGGIVYFRQTTDSKILAKAHSEITAPQAFPNLSELRLTWALIVTWDDVAFYRADKHCDGLYLRNYLQAILTTDGIRSFTIFNYNDIVWTTGRHVNSQGNCTGLGGHPARVGFDAGDNSTFFRVPTSCIDAVANIEETTNVGIAGKWIFAVDGPTIQNPPNSTSSCSKYKQKMRYQSKPVLKERKMATTHYYSKNPVIGKNYGQHWW